MATQPVSRWQVKEDLKYHPRHHWCRLEGTAVITGITDYTQERAGDILYASLPGIGETVQAGQPMGSIESGKWVGQLYAPVSGVVVASNQAVVEQPRLLNTAPYDQGWLVKIEPDRKESLNQLWDAAQYRAALDQIAEEL